VVGSTISTDDRVEALKDFFSEIEVSQHLKTPVAFEFDDSRDNAILPSVMQGKHWASTRTGEHLSTTVGYHRDTFTRTAEGWKMTGLKELVGWHEGNVLIVSNGQRKLIAKLSELYPEIDWERGVQQLMAGPRPTPARRPARDRAMRRGSAAGRSKAPGGPGCGPGTCGCRSRN
jgi:hypothetical protein